MASASRPLADEPIAIIGLDCKLPGRASTPQGYWDLLLSGENTSTKVPENRFNVDAFYHPDHERFGLLNTKKGNFLEEDLGCFDAPFFSVPKAEALTMDPQQRGLLESVYRSLENAGIPMDSVAGSRTSVVMGAFMRDYDGVLLAKDANKPGQYKATGNGTAVISNRISWFYDFRGPSISLDTACSSSLVACHLGIQTLRNGESDMSVIGGCNVWILPEVAATLADMGFLSPDGRCYSFDHKANGYSRGEGFGTVVLKRLSDAIRDGNTIRAIIRGSAVNQDGRTPGLTQPDSGAQTELMRQAYKTAGLDPKDTVFFEAHGTGTPAGDPIEARAIANMFAASHSPEHPIIVGAAKSNIGHVEGGAGVAGLIKAILCAEKGIIPPNADFEKPNPMIPVDEWNIAFPTAVMPWPTNVGVRRASINSFGYGGTNAHIIIDDAKSYLSSLGLEKAAFYRTLDAPPVEVNGTNGVDGSNDNKDTKGDYFVFPWSSSDEAGLKRIAATLHDYVSKAFPDDDSSSSAASSLLGDLSHTLTAKRSQLANTTFTVADSPAALLKALAAAPAEQRIRYSKNNTPRLALVFTGQGAQWPSMGLDLRAQFPVFGESCEAAFAHLRGLGAEWSAEAAWTAVATAADSSVLSVDNPLVSQTLCTVLQVALIDLFRHVGIVPHAVVGHSSGEIAAAYAAGAISREAAWAVAYFRGVVSEEVAASQRDGNKEAVGMMAVGLSAEDVAAELAQQQLADVSAACINSPTSVTLSGPTAQLETIRLALEAKSVFARLLRVPNAYHSKYMAPISTRYETLLASVFAGGAPSLASAEAATDFYSTVTGAKLDALSELSTPAYWVRNLLSPVRFVDAVAAMAAAPPAKGAREGAEKGFTHFLEVGPHSTLQGPIRESALLANAKGRHFYAPALKRKEAGPKTFMSALGWLHCHGFGPNIAALLQKHHPQMLVDLPPYPFDHSQIYWAESRISSSFRFRKHPRHELLGAPVPDWDPAEACWHNYLRHEENPWMSDHVVQGQCVYPAAGMLVMAIEAARQIASETAPDKAIAGFLFKDVFFHSVLNIPDAGTDGADVHFYLRPLRESATARSAVWSEFRLCTWSNDAWRLHCTGIIATEFEKKHTPVDAGKEEAEFIAKCRKEAAEHAAICDKSADPQFMYEAWNEIGWQFGPCFMSLDDLAYGVGATRMTHTGETVPFHSTATLKAADIAGMMKFGYVQDHLIHPAMLDGVLQSSLIGITKGGSDMANAMLPNSIPNLWLSADLAKHQPKLHLHGRGERLGFRKWVSWATAIDPATDKPLIVLEGAVGTEISKHLGTADEDDSDTAKLSSVRSPYYAITWKPDVTTLNRTQIESLVSKGFGMPENVPKLTEELEKLAYGYVYRCMKKIEESGGVEKFEYCQPYHRQYVSWMQHQLDRYQRGDILNRSKAFVECARDDDMHKALADKLLATSADGAAIATVGENIWEIMTGEVDALQLLFSGEVLSVLYRDGLGLRSAGSQLARYMSLLAHKNSALNILELGAGTGGTTVPLLEALCADDEGRRSIARFQSYDFTDISMGFFEKAQEKFSSYADRMRFKILDIETDPVEQGFTAASYDVVMAANVVHATKNIERSLKNARRLLKPGGKLVLLECTAPTNLGGPFVFGTLPGWWLSEEPHRQKQHAPLLDDEGWTQALAKSGFGKLDAVLKDHPGSSPEHQATSVLIATATEEEDDAAAAPTATQDQASDDKAAGPPAALTVLYNASSKMQTEVVEAIRQQAQAQGTDATVIEFNDFGRLVEDAGNGEKPCVSLLDLDRPRGEFTVTPRDFDVLKRACRLPALLWLNEGGGDAPQNPFADVMVGLARAARWEYLDTKFSVLSFADGPHEAADTVARTALQVLSMVLASDHPEGQYALEDNVLCLPRMLVHSGMNDAFTSRNPLRGQTEVRPFKDASNERALKLVVGSPGLLDSLHFVDDEAFDTPLGPNELEIEVKTTGLSFHDVLVALGRVEDPFMGGECAGYVSRVGRDVKGFKKGDRAVAIFLGSFRTYARGNALLAKKLPDNISFTAAATTPINYCTAYHALVNSARVKKGESVLIHWGAGGLGQAAIQLAQLFGCEVYTTVGSIAKRDALVEAYGIPEDHIFSSRDLSFAVGIKRMTGGRGVDVILNSTAGEALRASWDCIAYYGRFIEVGKYDAMTNSRLPMGPFMRNATFSFLDLCHVNIYHPEVGSDVLDKVIDLMAEGKITEPKPVVTYNYSQIEEAYRFMQSGRHVGKIVFEAHDDDLVKVAKSTKPQYSFKPDVTYVLAGGLGGVGRSIAQWLVRRGAKNVLFLSRSGLDKAPARELVEQLAAQGVNAQAIKCDVSDKTSLQGALDEASKTLPPVGGCIQGAMVLEDTTLENMNHEALVKVLGAKIAGSWNLYQQLPWATGSVDFYIMLSSISGVFGNPGQANYDMGNTFQDALARHAAVTDGRRVYTIDIGVLLGVGYVAENKIYKDLLRRTGFDSITEAEFLATMDIMCDARLPAPSAFSSQIVHGIATPEDVRKNGWAEPRWTTEPFFMHLHQVHRQRNGGDERKGDEVQYGRLVAVAATVEDAEQVVMGAIKEKLSRALAIAADEIEEANPLHKYGVDSLVAVELSTWFKKEIRAEVGVLDIMNATSITQLVQAVIARSSLVKTAEA